MEVDEEISNLVRGIIRGSGHTGHVRAYALHSTPLLPRIRTAKGWEGGRGGVSEVYKLGWLTRLYSMYSLLALPFSFCTSLIPDINLPTSIIYLITP